MDRIRSKQAEQSHFAANVLYLVQRSLRSCWLSVPCMVRGTGPSRILLRPQAISLQAGVASDGAYLDAKGLASEPSLLIVFPGLLWHQPLPQPPGLPAQSW